ncbi:MAG: GNAT family N-acetyltransferase [Polyangiaceae bacterium]
MRIDVLENRFVEPTRELHPAFANDRVALRPFVEDDAPDVFALYADREAVRFGFSPKMDDEHDAHRLIEETHRLARERTLFHFGVVERGRDRIVGHGTLFAFHEPSARAEVGYSVLRARWGEGLGTATVDALARLAFEGAELRRLEADVDPRNVASLRVLAKVGFEREGFARERWILNGEVQDSVLFGLLRRSWRGA